jgi:hypothetical protein
MKRRRYGPPRSAGTDGEIVARLRALWALITTAPAGSADVASDDVELDRIATGSTRSR